MIIIKWRVSFGNWIFIEKITIVNHHRSELLGNVPKFICYRPQRSWAKVIFSQACVCPQGGRGVCLSACWDTPPEQTPPRTRHTPPPPRSILQHTVNERMVRILLECILVRHAVLKTMSNRSLYKHTPPTKHYSLNSNLQSLHKARRKQKFIVNFSKRFGSAVYSHSR